MNQINYFSLDHLIVYGFLLSILVVGLYVGRKVKNIREYSIANKSYGTSVLLLTMLATAIGGGSSSGLAANIFKDGLIALIAFWGAALSILIVGIVIIPRMIPFKETDLSMADIMGRFYGKNAEVLTGILGFIQAAAAVGIQVKVLGIICETLLGTNKLTSLFLGGGIMVVYTAFGGIKSVAITDVLEFIVLIVIMPLLANLAITKAGGLENVVKNTPIDKIEIFEHHNFRYYAILFVMYLLPSCSLSPATTQRILMAKSIKQIKKIYILHSIISAVFFLMIALLGFAMFALNPEIDYRSTLLNSIESILPYGLKGFAIAGLLAVIMSTADSSLNVGSILLVHNVIDPISKKINLNINSFRLIRIVSLFIGVISIAIAYTGKDTLTINFYALSIFAPLITIPFIAALIGLKGDSKTFFTAVIATFITFILSVTFFQKDISVLLAIIVNTLVFLGVHLFKNKGFNFIPRSFEEEQRLEKQFSLKNLCDWFKLVIPTPKNVFKITTNNFRRYGSSHITFGAFFCINYIVPIFMWNYQYTDNVNTMSLLRFIGGTLCVGLLLQSRWPYKLKKFFPLYWYSTITFCLPFVSVAMYILMNGTTEWLINIALTIMLLAWLVDWKSFIILQLLGSVSGAIFGYYISGSRNSLSEIINLNDISSVYLLIYTILFSFIIGIIFFRKKENDVMKKLSMLRLMGGAMAHEVKNIVGIDSSNHMFLKMLFDKIDIDRKDKELIMRTDINTYDSIKDILNNIGEGTTKGLNIIKRTIVNMTKSIKEDDFEILKISDILKQSIAEYGMSKEQKNNIYIKLESDFKIKGSNYYMKHVFFNLFKNVYTFSREDAKIEIWSKDNILYFKDNGPGISKDILAHIFDYFFTTVSTGAGIGLPFSRMILEKMGGSLTCESQKGKNSFTMFILTFPIN